MRIVVATVAALLVVAAVAAANASLLASVERDHDAIGRLRAVHPGLALPEQVTTTQATAERPSRRAQRRTTTKQVDSPAPPPAPPTTSPTSGASDDGAGEVEDGWHDEATEPGEDDDDADD